jgi:hypothetical protein
VRIDKKFLAYRCKNRSAGDMETEIDVRQSMPASANPKPLLRIL